MDQGRIEAIYIAHSEGGPQRAVVEADLVAGAGIVGDRNFGAKGSTGQNLTLVEAEEIERFNAEHGARIDYDVTRRNILTRGIRLNDLVGKEFQIGAVRARGVRLCEPCMTMAGNLKASPSSPLDTMTADQVIASFTHKAGLRADVLSPGVIKVGDPIDKIGA